METNQEIAIINVLWDYYLEREQGGKPNIYIDYLAEQFPELNEQAKAKIQTYKK